MAKGPTRILVPAYDYPGPPLEQGLPRDWDVLLAVGEQLRSGGLLVVANPDDGPGRDNGYRGPDANYLFEIGRLRRVRASVVGYVTDCYDNTKARQGPDAACPRDTPVADDVDRWFDIYDVDGIFIDEVDEAKVEHAKDLVNTVKLRRNEALTVLNPGTIPSREFMIETDPAIVVIHENTFAEYQNWPPEDSAGTEWLRDRVRTASGGPDGIPAGRLAIIAHTPDGLTARQAVDRVFDIAQRHSIGWIYAWHGTGSVYNRLSSYLPDLADRIR